MIVTTIWRIAYGYCILIGSFLKELFPFLIMNIHQNVRESYVFLSVTTFNFNHSFYLFQSISSVFYGQSHLTDFDIFMIKNILDSWFPIYTFCFLLIFSWNTSGLFIMIPKHVFMYHSEKILHSSHFYYITIFWSTLTSWIYNYMCNQCLSPLKLWVQILLMARCTWYNIMW